jgi:integrase
VVGGTACQDRLGKSVSVGRGLRAEEGEKTVGKNVGAEQPTLALNKSGVWELRWTEWDAAAGRARSRYSSCRTRDRAVAEQARRLWLAAGAQVEDVAGSGVAQLVGEVCADYLRDRGYSKTGRGKAQAWALNVVTNALGDKPVSKLADLQTQWDYLRLRQGAGVASATMRRELGALKAVLAWAQKAGRLPKDFAPLITLPPEGAPRLDRLTEHDEARVWAAASDLFLKSGKPFRERRIGLFVCMALETAARESAIRGLTWNRVELWGGLPNAAAGCRMDFRDPGVAVSRKRRVPVPVSDRLLPVLLAAKAEGDGAAGGHVLGHSGKVRGAFEKFRGDLGLSWLHVHDLRRTWASLRVQWGVPLYEVAAVLGDTMEVVEKHYAHFAPGHLLGAVNARGRIGSGATLP